MHREVYRYTFANTIPLDEVEGSLLLSSWATASLHGSPETRLQAGYAVDVKKRACVVDASSRAGCDFNKIFLGLLEREFGETAFEVERIADEPVAELPGGPVASG